ncbi:hypothetical protein PR202_ga27922 [Eleusine coracana subsp. coracana]|uniref:Uncharacterized protein n=1 Tax=Eleusine coracana subsp. coracana TaxID=191504 RepID=A0AAV5DHR8_ELECO|nr:hypothetical protein PR202_ga27922 [Eleusine coracana subsp. coracana]
MEAIMDEPEEQGEMSKTPEEVVAQVLSSTKFLQNAGLQSVAAKRSSKSEYVARVHELEAEVLAEKQGAAAQQDKVEVLEVPRDKQKEEIKALKKHAEENDAIL